jgi:heavy metal translocating P-type ATPase
MRCCAYGAEDPAGIAARFPWLRLIIGLFVAGQTMLLGLAINLTPPESETTRIVLQGGMLLATLAIMALLGGPMVAEAWRTLRRGAVSMELFFLVCLLGSFALSVHSVVRGSGPVYFEVVAILLIVYSIGRAIGRQSAARALASAHALTDALKDARREDGSGVSVEALRPGERIVVRGGELIPVDGRVVAGTAFVRETAFTGEWIAAARGPGDEVIAATACEDGPLTIEVRRVAGDRRFARLTALIEEARGKPGLLERRADLFVRWFLPVVIGTSLAAGIYAANRYGMHEGIFRALAVLLVACPCAAGLASPLVIWTVLGRLARTGLLLRGGDVVEKLANVDTVVFDKTGTLGAEQMRVESIDTTPAPHEAAATLATLRAVEEGRSHPVAAALRSVAVPAGAPTVAVDSTRTLPGRGVAASVRRDGREHSFSVVRDDEAGDDGLLHLRVCSDGQLKARARLKERLRDGAESAVRQLATMGVPVTVLTGDGQSGAAHVARFASTETGLSPEDKLARVQALPRPLFVGDGFNDAAAMAASYTSVALASGSDVAIETADATLHGGDLTQVPEAMALARHAVRVIRSNLMWAVAYNFTGIALAVTGNLHPVLAALLMGASSAFVAWRSFHLASGDVRCQAQSTELPDPDARPVPPGLRRVFLGMHAVSLLATALLLGVLADLEVPGTIALVLLAGIATSLIARFWTRLPAWADMTLGMVTLGGFGMALGWWADVGFDIGTAATCPCVTPTGTQALTWMNAGMLALGVPAMYVLRHTWQRFRWSRWCCSGMLLLGVPGMVVGMLVASRLVHGADLGASASALVLIDMGAMVAGMVVGMLVPHALGYLHRTDRNLG